MVLRPALQGVSLHFSEPWVVHQLELSVDNSALIDRKMSLNFLPFQAKYIFQNIVFGNNALSCQRNKSSLEYLGMREDKMKYGNSTNINGVKVADSSILALPRQSISLYNDKRRLYRFFQQI